MAIVVFALEHLDLELSFAFLAKLHLENLTAFVGSYVEGVIVATAAHRHIIWTNDPESRAHAGELTRDRF